MAIVLKSLLGLAAMGFVLNVIVHALAMFDVSLLGFVVLGLFPLLFVLAIPTVMFDGIAQSNTGMWALGHCPTWMRYAHYGLIAYLAINVLLIVQSPPAVQQQQFEFEPPPKMIRLLSSFMMPFYLYAIGAMYFALTVHLKISPDQRPRKRRKPTRYAQRRDAP